MAINRIKLLLFFNIINIIFEISYAKEEDFFPVRIDPTLSEFENKFFCRII